MKVDFSKLAYICLYCANIQDSLHFYRDILGLQVLDESKEFISFQTGECRLALEPRGVRKDAEKIQSENPYLLQIQVDSLEDLAAMNAHLKAHQVVVLYESVAQEWGTLTAFLDPDGNKLELICQTG